MKLNVMAPLVVGDPADLNSEQSRKERAEFVRDLRRGRKLGVGAVSTDIWWALVQKADGQYDWSYPDMLLRHIKNAKLKWAPIFSFHQCGGNIGDTRKVLLPEFIWGKLAQKVASGNADSVKYVSERGNVCNEDISCWATDLVLPDLRAFFKAFKEHYANEAQYIVELNISLGPAGELRFPSYNSHDKAALEQLLKFAEESVLAMEKVKAAHKYDKDGHAAKAEQLLRNAERELQQAVAAVSTDFPTRGALQCYSDLAKESFRAWVLAKYKTEDGVRKAWGHLESIEPPVDVDAFFRDQVHINSQYGRDLFDWYSDSLLSKGRKIMTAAIEEFGSDGSPFVGIPVAAKVAGVHWRMGHWNGDKIEWASRLAELAAGLIRTSDRADWDSDEKGHGYAPIIALFKELQSVRPSTPIVLHFTCLEKADGEDAHRNAESLARSLVKWVGAEAKRQGVTIKGENALAWSLADVFAWKMMRSALNLPGEDGDYEGLTILRLNDILKYEVATSEARGIIEAMNRKSTVVTMPVSTDADVA